MQANQYHLIKLWPLRPHQTTRMNLQKTKKSGKIETKWWYSKNLETYLHVLFSNCLVPSCCTFSRPPIFSLSIRIPSPSLLCLIFYDPLMPPLFFSFSPLFVSASQTQYAQKNPLFFLLFPFLFQKSEYSSPLMQDLLLPYVCNHINSFFLIKYFSYLFERTYLSESWIAAPILLSNNRKTKIERIKTKRVSNLTTYQGLK